MKKLILALFATGILSLGFVTPAKAGIYVGFGFGGGCHHYYRPYYGAGYYAPAPYYYSPVYYNNPAPVVVAPAPAVVSTAPPVVYYSRPAYYY